MDRILFKQEKFTHRDIAQVVTLHRQEIGQGFLSSLGNTALELIFSLAARGKSGILITAVDPLTGQTCGFVCGTTNTGVFYREFLQRHLFTGLLHVAPKLLSPARLGRALETLLYPTQKTLVDLPKAELLIIAVDEANKGSGIAQALFYELVQTLHKRGVTRFKVVAGASLERAQHFYQKLDPIQVTSIEVHRRQRSTVFIYDVAEQITRSMSRLSMRLQSPPAPR